MKAFMKKCPLVMVTIVIALVVVATVVVKGFVFPAAGNKAQETHGNVLITAAVGGIFFMRPIQCCGQQ